jgi:hypothetical protein
MISVPLYLFILLYLLVVLAFLFIFFIHIYHLVATASVSLVSIAMTLFVGGMMVLIIGFTFLILAGIPWGNAVPLLNTSWFPGIFSPNIF